MNDVGYKILVLRCYNCGEKGWVSIHKTDPDSHKNLCPKCEKKFKKSGIPKLKDSNYKPDKYKFQGKGKLFIGVELEIDVLLHNTLDILECIEPFRKNKVFWCNHELSVDNGIELIFQPMSWKFITQDKTIENIMSVLGKKGVGTGSLYNCGLHFHINKSYFGKNNKKQEHNIYKFLYLFDKFQQDLILLSDRDGYDVQNFCGFFGKSERDRRSEETMLKEYNYGKYTAIYTGHEETIEVRLFSGTICYKDFQRYLNIVYKFLIKSQKYTIEELYKVNDYINVINT